MSTDTHNEKRIEQLQQQLEQVAMAQAGVKAALAEANELIDHLRGRTATLHLQVDMRDATIADLRSKLTKPADADDPKVD